MLLYIRHYDWINKRGYGHISKTHIVIYIMYDHIGYQILQRHSSVLFEYNCHFPHIREKRICYYLN
jgi:hypothetical protein